MKKPSKREKQPAPSPDEESILSDILEQKNMEERYRALFDQAPAAVFLVDAKTTRMVEANIKACESLGYTHEEFLKLGIPDFEAVESARETAKHARSILTNGSDRFESRWKTKSGEIRDVDVNVRVINIGDKPHFQTVIHDVSDRKRAENALRESEESFRNLAEQSPSMIFIHNGARIVFANKQCEKMMGYSCRELYSPGFSYMVLVAPEYHEFTVKAFRKHMKGQEVAPYEYVVVTKSGERFEAVIGTRLIKYHGERAILGVITDVSSFKRTEADLRRSEAQLTEQKKALQEKNVALKEILAQIETEKLQIRNEVAANVDSLVMPILRKLRKAHVSDQSKHLDLLENSLKNVTSQFGIKVGKGMADLSPGQIEICNMIRNNMASKEIADLLHISLRTVETQRNRIRKKFGLSGQGVNLAAYLQTLE